MAIELTKKEQDALKRAKKQEAARHHMEVLKEEKRLSQIAKVAPNDSFIILKNVNKIYENHVQAVFNFNLDIKEKEFIVFVGPSGCGKSTTLRMIAGLEDITYGDLFIDGKYCNLTPPKERNLAMVFQNYALYPHMNVYSNMAFGIKIRKAKTFVYEPSPILDGLHNQKATIQKQLKKMKSDNPLYENYTAQINQLNEKIEEEEKKRKPVLFLDKAMCKYIQKEIAKNRQAIIETQRASIRLINPEEIDNNKKLIAELEKNLAKLEEQYRYYQTTPVPKYVYRHLSKEEIDKRVQNAALILGLKPYLDRKPSAMSGGQRQRVALGRAIVRNSKLLLMDEPLSNLDAKLRVQMRSEIAQLHKRIGSTTIYVTHDQTEAMTMADRIVVMKDGHVQQIGTPSEIYDHPSNTFVAGFIGSPAMNIFKAKVVKDTIVLPDGFKIDMSKEQIALFSKYIKEETEKIKTRLANIDRMEQEQISSGHISEGNKKLFDERREKYKDSLLRFEAYNKNNPLEVEFGIRAEDIISGPDMVKFNHLSDTYKAKVLVAEFLGHEYFIHYNMGDTRIVAKIPITKSLIKNGDVVEIKINLDKIHLFEINSTNTIF